VPGEPPRGGPVEIQPAGGSPTSRCFLVAAGHVVYPSILYTQAPTFGQDEFRVAQDVSRTVSTTKWRETYQTFAWQEKKQLHIFFYKRIPAACAGTYERTKGPVHFEGQCKERLGAFRSLPTNTGPKYQCEGLIPRPSRRLSHCELPTTPSKGGNAQKTNARLQPLLLMVLASSSKRGWISCVSVINHHLPQKPLHGPPAGPFAV